MAANFDVQKCKSFHGPVTMQPAYFPTHRFAGPPCCCYCLCAVANNALEWPLTKWSVPSFVKIGQQIPSEVKPTVASFGGFYVGAADGSVPFLREHCGVATSH